MSDAERWDHDYNPECLGCRGEHGSGGHYECFETAPCDDCRDEGLMAAENVAAGFGPNGEDT